MGNANYFRAARSSFELGEKVFVYVAYCVIMSTFDKD